jgi:hypothetical protein
MRRNAVRFLKPFQSMHTMVNIRINLSPFSNTMSRMQQILQTLASPIFHISAMIHIIFRISILFNLLRRRSTWHRQIPNDILAYALCLRLRYHLSQHRQIWAFCLALGYTTWNLLPGSFASLDLPSHASFMQRLELQDKSAECMVCWDVHTLAELPCGHGVCKPCLHLMGTHTQTACPMCRTPLFGVMDWPVLAAMKTAISSLTVVTPLCLRVALDEGKRNHYRNFVIWMGSFYLTGVMLWGAVTRMIIPRGDNWWRLSFGQWRLGHVGVIFGSSVWSLGLMVWLQEGIAV